MQRRARSRRLRGSPAKGLEGFEEVGKEVGDILTDYDKVLKFSKKDRDSASWGEGGAVLLQRV
jgi:hypothetical protein